MKETFANVVTATGKNFEIEQSLTGYFRLMLEGSPVVDLPDSEDLNGSYEEAETYVVEYLLEHEVPEEKKVMRCGQWFLK